MRYNSNGSLDTMFGINGLVTTEQTGMGGITQTVIQQADGKLLVQSAGRGNFDCFCLARYNMDGTLDKSFGTNGMVQTTSVNGIALNRENSIALQPDNKIILSGHLLNGYVGMATVRYNADGSIDTSFGTQGIVTTAIDSFFGGSDVLVLQSDGKIVVAGTDQGVTPPTVAIVRYTSDGTLDSTFNGNGILGLNALAPNIYVNAETAIRQLDDKIIITGTMTEDFRATYIARILTDESETTGENPDDEAGTAVTTADIDGDGTEDIISGAPFANALPASTFSTSGYSENIKKNAAVKKAGIIKIISGKDHTIIGKISGTAANQNFGSVVAAVADQDNDGTPDLLVGEPKLDRVSLYSGATGSLIKTVLAGINKIGSAIAVGDINNDSIDDLIVGTGAGAVYVYDGATVYNTTNPTPLYVRKASQKSFGSAVAVDNQHRLLIGAPKVGAGTVYVFSGVEGSSAPLFTLTGKNKGEQFGKSISVLKSTGDWLIGAPTANERLVVNGKTVVRKRVGAVRRYSSSDAFLLAENYGHAKGDHLGGAINASSDIDKDGISDVVIGSPASDVRRAINRHYVLKKRSGRVNVMKSGS